MLRYLKGAELRRRIYSPSNPGWMGDHEHCVLCGAKFSARPEDLQDGLVTTNGTWICEACFEEYCEEYQWKLCRE